MTNGNVFSVTIDNPGANYSSAPSITFSGPTGTASHGSGATAEAVVVNEQVTQINITNAGTGYDLAPDIIVSAPTRTTRRATGTPVVIGGSVTGITITDPGFGYLRTPTVTIGNPSDIDPDADIVGGEFIDVYNSHAPEELVPGAIFDTLDLKVFTRPGYDYSGNGHGFEIKSVVYANPGIGNTVSWGSLNARCAPSTTLANLELVNHPTELVVYNASTGTRLYEGINYTINWADKTVQLNSGLGLLDEVKIFVYGIGGGNQLFRNSYLGGEIVNKTLTLPVNYDDIESVLVLVDGDEISNYSYAEGVFASQTVITFDVAYTDSNYINVTIFGANPAEDGSTITDLTYSYPETEVFTCDGSTNSFTLSIDVDNKNRENLIVELNGRRLQPPTAKRHIGDGSSITTYELPDGLVTGIDMSEVDDDEVVVYVNQVRQVSGIDYQLDAPDDSSYRTISFLSEVPGPYDIIDIYVTKTEGEIIDGIQQGTHAGYELSGDSSETLTVATGYGINLNAGDKLAVTAWRDVREQDVFTQIFKGPVTVLEATRELFDSYGFDMDLFDRSTGAYATINVFELEAVVENTDRMWVTLNGRRLLPGADYSVSTDGTTLVISGGAISDTDIIAVTTFTSSIVPDSVGFRIFKDMRDNVAVYRNNTGSQTFLARTLKWTDDVIYVDDASKLGTPNLNAAIFGILEINGERITYRDVDLVNNTIGGLRRGTAGTGMQREHSANSMVTDLSRGQLLQTSYDEIWYEQGIGEDSTLNTASNGVALQQQTTTAAKFLRGL